MDIQRSQLSIFVLTYTLSFTHTRSRLCYSRSHWLLLLLSFFCSQPRWAQTGAELLRLAFFWLSRPQGSHQNIKTNRRCRMSLDDLGRLNEIHCECKELKFEVVYKYTLLSEILLFFIDSSAFKHTFSMSNLMDYLGYFGTFCFFGHPLLPSFWGTW